MLPAGITAGSQSLAGMTAEEAKAAGQDMDGLAAQSVTLSVDGQDVATTAGAELATGLTQTQLMRRSLICRRQPD